MTEGIVQKVISKYLSLYDSPEPESKKLMYYLKPLMNDLQQELIEAIKQEFPIGYCEYHPHIIREKLIGDNQE